MMMKKLLVAVLMLVSFFGLATVYSPAAYAACPPDTVLAIPAWYKGLQQTDCSVKAPDDTKDGVKNFAIRIGLNIIQALMVIVAYVAVFFIIKGGFEYITSAGSSEGMASARKTITNAVIGMIIAILAASIVNAVAGIIK